MSDGRILQVLGAVVDVEFPPGKLPEVFNALTISNPAIDARQLQRILDAVATQVVPVVGHAYVFGEAGRLAQPVAYVARRGVLAEADWQAWLDGLAARLGPMPEGGDDAWLARRHDLTAFLSAIYIQADASQNEALRALKPHVAKALAGGG